MCKHNLNLKFKVAEHGDSLNIEHHETLVKHSEPLVKHHEPLVKHSEPLVKHHDTLVKGCEISQNNQTFAVQSDNIGAR